MDKVLESLERLKNAPSFMGGTVEYQYCTDSKTPLMQDYEIVRQAILELKSIKEANPSEALECLKHIRKYYIPEPYSAKTYDCLETIKQALLKPLEFNEILDKYWVEDLDELNTILSNYRKHYR